MLEKRYAAAAKKFPLGEVPIGELVIMKVEPFTPKQLKKDPKLAELDEPTVYGVGMVVKRLKNVTRVESVWIDIDGFSNPEHVDLSHADEVVWLAEAAMPIARMPDEEPLLGLPEGYCSLRATDHLAGFVVDHIFKRPTFADPGGNRAVTSLNAHSNAFAARTASNGWGDVSLTLHRVEDMHGWMPASAVVTHPDIWSAYRAVGYDYKARKLDETKVLSGDHK